MVSNVVLAYSVCDCQKCDGVLLDTTGEKEMRVEEMSK